MGKGRGKGGMQNFDFFRKVPRDFTEGTVPGSALSIVATVVMVSLFFLELKSFLTVKVVTDIIMDPGSEDGNDLGINFRMNMPELVRPPAPALVRRRAALPRLLLSGLPAHACGVADVPLCQHRRVGHDGH